MIFRLALIASLAVFALIADNASAAQYQSGENVVHTRLAPVVVHRVFPPYLGVHKYQGGGGSRRGR